MDKDGPETMREAVARAMDRSLRLRSCGETPPIEPDMVLPYIEGAVDLDVLAQDAIRTVLERLREPTSAMVEAADNVEVSGADLHDFRSYDCAKPVWQAMLDAAVRKVG